MSKHGLQHRGLIRRSKILRSAVKLFLEKGYASTTTPEIMKATGMSASSFFAAFKDKEALLLTLVGHMFESQFKNAGSLLCADIDPLMLYAVETALQMHITELSEPLRELYVTAYTLTSTAEYIHRNTAKKLPAIFHPYQPNATEKDFYELELASSGVTRSYMAKPCDMYFPMEQKLRRYLGCCFRIYDVPREKYEPVIEAVLRTDLHTEAEKIIAETVAKAEAGFEALLEETQPHHGSL